MIIAMLLLGKIEAAACSRMGPIPSDEELYKEATAVFVAHVVRVEESALSSPANWLPAFGGMTEGTIRIVEVLKGNPPADNKLKAPALVPCQMPILVGLDYLFFLYTDNIIRPADEGTRPFLPDEKVQRQRVLEKLRGLRKEP